MSFPEWIPASTPPDPEAAAFRLADMIGYGLERATPGYVISSPMSNLEAPTFTALDVLGHLGFLAAFRPGAKEVRKRVAWKGPVPDHVQGPQRMGLQWLAGDDSVIERMDRRRWGKEP